MPEQISQRIEHCYVQAEHFYERSFPRPEVRFDLRGKSAGAAYPLRNLLRFNVGLYQGNKEHFLQQTVAHEVAHLLVSQLHGLRVRPHGREWREVMEKLFRLPALRCHDYRLPSVWRTFYEYACDCRRHDFSPQRHGRARRGNGYLCRACRQPLSFTGKAERRLVDR